jgi:NitT/TauT family transport system ATP-binding protein
MAPQSEAASATQKPGPASLLEVEAVTLQYRTRQHLVTATHQVSFNVGKEERFILLGPSGCGKSTLLKAIGGFIHPVEGQIRLNGKPVREPGPDRLMVFQEFDQLLPWKTVKSNIMFPLMVSGRKSRAEAGEIALHYIEKVGLARFADAYPHMLSGGMKQRVALARALASQPEILLMDEPFAALDALTRRKMQEELLGLWDEARFTVIFVTHSIEEAILVGSRILILSPHPGQVKAEYHVDGLTRADSASPDFAALSSAIHDTLFTDRVEEAAPVL